MSVVPPPTLSPDDVRRVADVRRDVWTAGMSGLVGGTFAGSTGWVAARYFGALPPVLRTRNAYAVAVMGGGAFMSFLCSLAAGKNSVRRIGDVFRRNATPPDAEEKPYAAAQFETAAAMTDDGARRRGRAAALAEARLRDATVDGRYAPPPGFERDDSPRR